jgi:hypothetical protein
MEEPSLLWSISYIVLRRVVQLAPLRLRSDEFKELDSVVLRRELGVRELGPSSTAEKAR